MSNPQALVYRKAGHRAWPVDVELLEADKESGDVVKVTHRFIAHFKLFSEEDFAAALEAATKAVPAPNGKTEDNLPQHIVLKRNAHAFCLLMGGWSKVVGEDGAPTPFSAEALTALVTGPDGGAVSGAINQALFQIRLGIAPAKNSNPSPPPGPSGGEGEAPTS